MDASSGHQKQKTTVPTISGNYDKQYPRKSGTFATSPKISFQRQGKIQGPLGLNDKIAAQTTKHRLKSKQMSQEPESSKKHAMKK